MKRGREILGAVGVCTLAWLAFTCGGDEAPPPAAPALSPPARPGNRPDDPPTAQRELVEALRATRDLPRHASDAAGRAWLEPAPDPVSAGERGRFSLVFEAGPEGVAEGGCVRLSLSPWWDWSTPQASAPDAPGYVTAECSDPGVVLEPRQTPQGLEHVVRGKRLDALARVTLVYGAGSAGARTDRYAERESRFWIAVDGDGDGHAFLLPDSPAVDVGPGPAGMLSAVLPSTAEPGDTVVLRLAFLDGAGSRGARFTGDVVLVARPEGLEVPATVSFTEADRGVKRVELQATTRGVFRLLAQAEVEGGELLAAANPLLVEPGVAHVRWADLHGHSNLSDGTGTPEDYLDYARDVAGLDAVCLTDHDHWGMLPLDAHPALWDRIQTATESRYAPGEFVTLLGYEWTNWIHGHRHVLYFGADGPVLSSVDERYETPAQLWEALRGLPALTFAHHSAGGPIATNWAYAPDPELEPVTEIASVHGSSEAPDAPARIYDPLAGNFVRDVLDRGVTLGFIGSGDGHDGHPGLSHLGGPRMGGLAALLTQERTREAVQGALKERRCYATNGPRILLRAALDGHRMGSAVPPKAGKSLLYVRAIACAPLASLELVRGGKVVESIAGADHWDVEAAFEPHDLVAGEYLYVRAVQVDSGAAWSSPFYVR